MLVNYIQDRYIKYLNRIDKEKNKEDDIRYYRASSSGMCIKQLHYRRLGFDKRPIEDDGLKIMRLGTLIHEDIEKAIGKVNVLTEYEITCDKYNIQGHLDYAFIDKENKRVDVVDLKSIGSYPYKLKFGRTQDKNPSTHQEMQVATYAYILSEEYNYNPYDAEIWLLYYNKDNSKMKSVRVSNIFIDKAIEYWEEVNSYNDVTKETIEKEFNNYNPTQAWVCRYCRYNHICSIAKEIR